MLKRILAVSLILGVLLAFNAPAFSDDDQQDAGKPKVALCIPQFAHALQGEEEQANDRNFCPQKGSQDYAGFSAVNDFALRLYLNYLMRRGM